MIKNYTAGKKAGNSQYIFDRINKTLIEHNAKSINFLYKNGKVDALIFVLEIFGKDFGFKLPARVENVESIFLKNKKPRHNWEKPSPLTEDEKQQAYRTAWANIKDWLEAQMALIETEQVKIHEVFMPYLVVNNNSQSLFEHYEEEQFKALPEP